MTRRVPLGLVVGMLVGASITVRWTGSTASRQPLATGIPLRRLPGCSMMNLSERRSWLRRLNAAVRSSLCTVRVCYWRKYFPRGERA
jgi:hypothetical protein